MRQRLMAALLVVIGVLSGGAAFAEDGTAAAARQALDGFFNTVAKADIAALEAVLAPEFQILRADGTGFDRAGYLNSGLPTIALEWRVDDLVVTSEGDVMVARYVLEIDETIEGRATARRAPRLTVFQRDGDHWLVTAHANFAPTQ